MWCEKMHKRWRSLQASVSNDNMNPVQWSRPLRAIWRAPPPEWAHQHLSLLASRCSIDALWHCAQPIYHSAQSHNLLLLYASWHIQAAIWIWDAGREEEPWLRGMRSERLSRGLKQQGIVNAWWQVHVIAQRNCCRLWFTAGNQDEMVL